MISRSERVRLEHWFMDEVNTRIQFDSDYTGILFVSNRTELDYFIHNVVKYEPLAMSYTHGKIKFENGATLHVLHIDPSISEKEQAQYTAGRVYITVAYSTEAFNLLKDYHFNYMRTRLRTLSESNQCRLSIV